MSPPPKETVTTVTLEKLSLLRFFGWSFFGRLLCGGFLRCHSDLLVVQAVGDIEGS